MQSKAVTVNCDTIWCYARRVQASTTSGNTESDTDWPAVKMEEKYLMHQVTQLQDGVTQLCIYSLPSLQHPERHAHKHFWRHQKDQKQAQSSKDNHMQAVLL